MKTAGGYYTCANNQDGDGRVLSRIDRCLGNTSWFLTYSDIMVEILEKGVSHHCPLQISFDQTNVYINTPSRFLNVIPDHDDFLVVVSSVWNQKKHGNCLLNMWYKPKALKGMLK